MIQPHIDGESGESDRIIVEEHLAACPRCARVYRHQQRMTASLFEALRDHRLPDNLAPSVMAHLPEMDANYLESHQVTYRAKHPPAQGAGRFLRLIPLFAPVLIVALGLALVLAWPGAPRPQQGVVGMVLQRDGTVTRSLSGKQVTETVHVRNPVYRGDAFETGPDSTLMLGLMGPTELKISGDTLVRVRGNREVAVQQGRAWFHVDKDVRLFRVSTPSGNVVVLGTTFDVAVDANKTVVTVLDGRVHVENGVASYDLTAGERVEMNRSETLQAQTTATASRTPAWTGAIEPNRQAKSLFLDTLATPAVQSLAAEQVFVVQTDQRTVHEISFSWNASSGSANREGYNVYVSDDYLNLMFVARIPGYLFTEPGPHTYTLAPPDGPIEGVRVLHIKVVPASDREDGAVTFTNVSAWGA